MNRRRFRPGPWLAILLTGGFLLSGPDAAAQGGCVTAQCHATLLNAGTVHPPVESCDSCHESTGAPHPRQGARTFKLVQAPPGLCTTCHDPFGTKSQVHPPAQEGMCTTCHNPHASDQPKLLVQPIGDLCQSCHADQAQAKFLHGPVSAGDCTACHAPHESDAKPLLRTAGDDLCFECHSDIQGALKKQNVHPALAGGCTSCHNPHGAAYPKLLAEEGAGLCFQCHDAIAEKVQKSPILHAALKDGKGCVSCHSPHASDNAKLLLKPQRETCLGCHATLITKTMTTLHRPISEGACTPCHDPHGGREPKLLVKEFPVSPYVPYTDGEFALCFGCHDRDMVRYPDTSVATGFRDGERNLHYLHVHNERKGRSCALCHELHGSGTPRLVADSVPFGAWRLPIKFVKSETGGSCAPGCHRPQAYDRQSPGRKPAAPKPAAAPHGRTRSQG